MWSSKEFSNNPLTQKLSIKWITFVYITSNTFLIVRQGFWLTLTKITVGFIMLKKKQKQAEEEKVEEEVETEMEGPEF